MCIRDSACADAHRMQGLQDTPRLALVKTGGIFYDNYCVWGGTDKILPVSYTHLPNTARYIGVA